MEISNHVENCCAETDPRSPESILGIPPEQGVDTDHERAEHVDKQEKSQCCSTTRLNSCNTTPLPPVGMSGEEIQEKRCEQECSEETYLQHTETNQRMGGDKGHHSAMSRCEMKWGNISRCRLCPRRLGTVGGGETRKWMEELSGEPHVA